MKKVLLLGLILIIALAWRIVGLAKRPLGFTWDEAALGYNAYSLLVTGKDEYGKTLPVILKSFGDYKPGLYAYLIVPPIKLLGMTETATRLPSAIMGTLLVAAVYLLAHQLWGSRPAFFASVIMAFNPWAIHFSRGAWEANVALLLTTLGVILFLQKRYFLSAAFMGLTFWTYQGAKMFTPLMGGLLLLQLWPQLQIKKLITPGLVFLALVVPIVWGLAGQAGRLKVLSVFAYRRSEAVIAEIMHQDGLTTKVWWYYLFHSELYDQIRGIEQRYTNHFSPYFLFFAGDWSNARHSIPYSGYFHLPEAAFLLTGIYLLIKKGERKNLLVWGWLLLAPVPAALSRDIVSGIRALPMIVPLALIMGVGLAHLSQRKWLLLSLAAVWAFFVVYFGDLYFVHTPFFTSEDWLVAYKPAWQIVRENANQYEKVIFTDKLGQPYIFGLFYLQVDPRTYQAQARLTENAQGDVGQVTSFDKFEFRPLYWPADRGLSNTLFVGGEYELPEHDLVEATNLVRIGEIKYPNNTIGLKVVGLK